MTSFNPRNEMTMKRSSGHHENIVVGALCVSFGAITFDMIGVNYLIPFIVPTLRLNNLQVGTALSGYWITFAISSYFAGIVTDRSRARKRLIVGILCVFSILSLFSGLVDSFVTFLAARLAMGSVAGAFLPPAQSIVAVESSFRRLGLNMGLLQNVGSSLAALVAPLLLVYVAETYNWRAGFFIAAVPGLLCVAMVGGGVREPKESVGLISATSGPESGGIRQLLTYRNVYLCAALAVLFNANTTIGHGFLPLYLTRVAHISLGFMSVLMSILGLSGAIFGIVMPALSDRVGRRPVSVFACALGALCPIGALYFYESTFLLAALLFLGWAQAGASAVFSATILSETVPAGLLGTAFGLVATVSTIGGVLAGPIAGWAADRWGLSVPLAIEAACCVAMVGIAFGLRETAPGRRSLQTETLVPEEIG